MREAVACTYSKTLQEQLGVSSVEAEVILRGRARFKPDGRANNVSHGFRFRLADAPCWYRARRSPKCMSECASS